jgi:hypothetical protein
MSWEPTGKTESEGRSQYSLRVVSVCERSAGIRVKSKNNMSFATVIIFMDQLNRAIVVEYSGNPNEGTSSVKTRPTNLWDMSIWRM